MKAWVPALLGCAVVLQGALNRRIAQTWSLPSAVLLNAVVLLSCALGFWIYGSSSSIASRGASAAFSSASSWFLLPGILGFSLVFGVPWSLSRFGAAYTFTLLIGAQLAASLLWDVGVEGLAVSPSRVLGMVITWIGVAIALR